MPQTNNQIDNQNQQVDNQQQVDTVQSTTTDTSTQIPQQNTADNQNQQPDTTQQPDDSQNQQTQTQDVDSQNQNQQQTTNEPITFEDYIVKGNGEVSIVGSDLIFQAKREEMDTTSTIAVQAVRGNLKSVPVEIDVNIISTFLKVFPTQLQTIERGLSQQFDIQTDALDYEITATPDTNVLIDKQKKIVKYTQLGQVELTFTATKQDGDTKTIVVPTNVVVPAKPKVPIMISTITEVTTEESITLVILQQKNVTYEAEVLEVDKGTVTVLDNVITYNSHLVQAQDTATIRIRANYLGELSDPLDVQITINPLVITPPTKPDTNQNINTPTQPNDQQQSNTQQQQGQNQSQQPQDNTQNQQNQGQSQSTTQDTTQTPQDNTQGQGQQTQTNPQTQGGQANTNQQTQTPTDNSQTQTPIPNAPDGTLAIPPRNPAATNPGVSAGSTGGFDRVTTGEAFTIP